MASQSRNAKRSGFRSIFNLIPWAIAIVLIIGVLAVVTEAKAGTVGAADSATSSVGSPSLTAPSIGWELDRTEVVGTQITWTPESSGSYTINVMVGDSFGSATVWVSGSVVRTDSVNIWPAIDPMYVESVNLVINEN